MIQYRTSGEKWNPAVVMWKKWRLVGPDQLFNIADDPHQDNNLAEQCPKIVRAMSDHYNAWYAEAKSLFEKPRWITVGSETANPMMLYAQDWVGGYCDNRGGLIQATATGYWNVIVQQDGVYELELRRWPKEALLPLSVGIGNGGKDGARPISAANVQIAGANCTIDNAPDDTHVTFQIRLKAGRAQLATAMLDQQDRTLCSAIYVKLTRLADDANVTLTPTSTRKPIGLVPPPSLVKAASSDPVKMADDDILIADFEGDGYGDWKIAGTAFGARPTTPNGRVAGHQGKSFVDTFLVNESDAPTGTLTSAPFTIAREHINFLIGGGKTAGETCINLVVDETVVHTAVGSAAKDQQARKIMNWVTWDVSDMSGKEARLEILDQHSGGWGHIMIDHIFLSRRAMANSKE